ncbi:MAG: RNA-processing protein [Methanocalculus sp.]|uniref:RNA-processing protein n=1 Tax=Methanocalculus sp. TaxID=2004547 RepID=UPI002717FE18|nr:RNA-processing protein [Methanocalculus sp.]MDO9538683.1 RNA-processing protein [Methanocalculus sp.]
MEYWCLSVDDRGDLLPVEGAPPDLLARVRSIATDMRTFRPLTADMIQKSGLFSDRSEYIRRLREVTTLQAREEIRDAVSGKDAELLQMVRMLDQMDEVINLLSERLVEWYQVTNPAFSQKGKQGSVKRILPKILRSRSPPLRGMAKEMEGLMEARTALAAEVSRLAGRVIPNTSELVGGLVAARIMARAGGLEKLARMPGSSVQVIGAEAALFSHIRQGSPSPKHGIIFQHRRVHNAPREVRGRVARVLAAKLAIGARIDFFRGEPDPEFLASAQAMIDSMVGGSL